MADDKIIQHSLDAQKVIETAHMLHKRIDERFPQSGFSQLCIQLCKITEETEFRCQWFRKPHTTLRVGVSIVVMLILLLFVAGFFISVKFFPAHTIDLFDFFQMLEAIINLSILIGVALLFLVTTENRRKRKRAMFALHQLRDLSHVIDMHQLTKDPERITRIEHWTNSSPRETMNAFLLTRYLTYCTEMLSLVGKVAALYAQNFEDDIVLMAVNEVENLTTNLSSKIWQKITILHRLQITLS